VNIDGVQADVAGFKDGHSKLGLAAGPPRWCDVVDLHASDKRAHGLAQLGIATNKSAPRLQEARQPGN
jgi:hypothetical protein